MTRRERAALPADIRHISTISARERRGRQTHQSPVDRADRPE